MDPEFSRILALVAAVSLLYSIPLIITTSHTDCIIDRIEITKDDDRPRAWIYSPAVSHIPSTEFYLAPGDSTAEYACRTLEWSPYPEVSYVEGLERVNPMSESRIRLHSLWIFAAGICIAIFISRLYHK